MRRYTKRAGAVSALMFGAVLVMSAAQANVQTYSCSFAHTTPTGIGSYGAGNPVEFSDSTTYVVNRITPLQSPESITVYTQDGYSNGNGDINVNRTSTSHSWSGMDVTQYNDGASVDGYQSFSAGTYGYFCKLTCSISGGTEQAWTSYNGGTSRISGGFTVHP